MSAARLGPVMKRRDPCSEGSDRVGPRLLPLERTKHGELYSVYP